jgi:hypothetical protein
LNKSLNFKYKFKYGKKRGYREWIYNLYWRECLMIIMLYWESDEDDIWFHLEKRVRVYNFKTDGQDILDEIIKQVASKLYKYKKKE